MSKRRRLFRVQRHVRVTQTFLVDAESPSDARRRVLTNNRSYGTVLRREPDELLKQSAHVEAA